MSSERRLRGARIVGALGASALLLAPSLGSAQAPRAVVVVSVEGSAAPELSSQLEQVAAAHLRAEGHDVVDGGTIRAAVHFHFADAIPADEAGLEELRAQVGAARLLHVNVDASAPDRPLSIAVRDLSDRASTAAFGEIPPDSPGELATILARLPPAASTPRLATAAPPEPAPVEVAPAAQVPVSGGEAQASDSSVPTPGEGAPSVGEPDEGSAEVTPPSEPYRFRIGAGLLIGYASTPASVTRGEGNADAPAGVADVTYSAARTLLTLAVDLDVADWFSVRLLGHWFRPEVWCTPSPGTTVICPRQSSADLLGAGVGLGFRIPVSVPVFDRSVVIVAPSFRLSASIFPTRHGRSPGILAQAELGVRATWRFDRMFGVFVGGGLGVDVTWVDPIELGFHPGYPHSSARTYYLWALLVGGSAELGAEISF